MTVLSGYTERSVGTGVTDNSGGTANATSAVVAAAFKQTVQIPVQLADFANSQVYKVAIPFAFTLTGYSWRSGKPTSTGAKAASIQSQINAVGTTGGALSLASNTDTGTTGAAKAASAVTALNVGTAGQTLEFAISGVTAFTEGDGWIEATVVNNDLANVVATLIAN